MTRAKELRAVVAWGLFPIAVVVVAGAGPTSAAGRTRPIRTGETARAVMPAGGREKTSVPFELSVDQSGRLAIEVRSFDFDTGLRVSRVGPGDTLVLVGENDDGGIGSNSRLVLEAKIGARYRIEARPVSEEWGGDFEISVVAAAVGPTDDPEHTDANLAYWGEVESRATGKGNAGREARALRGRAQILAKRGSYAEARSLYEKALAIRERLLGPEHQDVATSLAELGGLLFDMGLYAEAKPLRERALAIQEKVLGPEHIEVARSLVGLGNLLDEMGSYAEARLLLERALTIDEKRLDPEDPEITQTLEGLAVVLHDLGSFAEAKRYHERALAIAEKQLGLDHLDVAAILHSFGALLNDMGAYAEAKSLLERGLTIREQQLGPKHPLVASTLNNLAYSLQRMGSYADARTLYERALEIKQEQLGPEHPLLANAINNVAGVLRDMGSYAEAKPLFERAVAIREKALGPEHPLVAQGLHNIALVLFDMGAYAEAKPLLERSLAIAEKQLGPEHPSVAVELYNLALLLQETGSYAEAKQFFLRALDIRERALGPDNPELALTLRGLAQLLFAMGDTEGALERALAAEEIGRKHLQMASRSLTERQALRYESVRASGLNVALSLAERLDSSGRERAWDAIVRSRALVLDEMASRHRAIVSASGGQEMSSLAAQYASTSQRLSNLMVRGPGPDPAPRYRTLLDEAKKQRELAEQALAAGSASFREELAQGRLGATDVRAGLPVEGALVSYVQYQRIELPKSATIVAGDPKPSSGGTAPRPRPKSVPSYLAFVLIARGEPILVPLGKAEDIDELVSRWKSEAAEGAFRPGRSGAEAQKAYVRAGEALRRKIWDPVAAHAKGARDVYLIPDGVLNLVNFSALPARGGGYLIEADTEMHILSAERDLAPSKERQRRGEGILALGGPAFDEASLYGSLAPSQRAQQAGRENPMPPTTFNQPAPGNSSANSDRPYRGPRSGCVRFQDVRFEPLPASRVEVEEVCGLWEKGGVSDSGPTSDRPPGALSHDPVNVEHTQASQSPKSVTKLIGPEASEIQFKTEAPGRRVLHLATHGFFLGDRCGSSLESSRGVAGLVGGDQRKSQTLLGENPLLLSGLALAGANHRKSAGPDEEDGILTAEEIAAMDLSGVEWVVLSACDTGKGEVKAGEGVFGLRRAFRVAGAGTVIMSLWSVEDNMARAWMKALYEGRYLGKRTTGEAVRGASLALLRDRRQRKQSTHPFYWAGFVASGDLR